MLALKNQLSSVLVLFNWALVASVGKIDAWIISLTFQVPVSHYTTGALKMQNFRIYLLLNYFSQVMFIVDS
jgi:hypothetical protein